jgi:hypothetical protein
MLEIRAEEHVSHVQSVHYFYTILIKTGMCLKIQ